MSDAIDRVGLGVDLLGGPELLTNLRAIRTEMQAIASLGNRGGSGPSERSSSDAPQRQAAINKKITDDEIAYYADSRQRKAEIKRLGDTELIRREIATQAELTRIQERADAERIARQRLQYANASSPALARRLNQSEIEDIAVGTRSGIGVRRFVGPSPYGYSSNVAREGPDPYGLSSRYTSPPNTNRNLREAYEQEEYLRTRRAFRSSASSRETPEQTAFREYSRKGGDPSKFVFSGGGGGGGGPEEPEEGGGSGGGSGVGSAVSRIARNLLLYEGITLLTRGVVKYTEAALENAKAVSEQANALLFATEAAGGNLEANRALATGLQSFGYNRAQALEVVSTAARATFRHPEQTDALAREATNIAALRGGGLSQTPKVIEDIIGGRDRAYREYFNITPEEIYKQAAQKNLQNQPRLDPGFHTIGKQDYETDTQKVSKYIAALTEEEKEQLRLNYVLTQSFRFEGDAADRAVTLAGKMDLVSASFFNASANVGAFIADIKPVKDLLDQIAEATPGGIFAPPQLRQSGPRSTITDANVTEFAADSSTSERASALTKTGKIGGFLFNLFDPFEAAGSLYHTAKHVQNRLTGVEGPGISDQEYDSLIAENIAKTRQVRQRSVLRQDNQLGYRRLNTDPSDESPEYSTYAQLSARGLSAGDILKNYIEDIKPVLTGGAKDLAEYRQKRQELLDQINSGSLDKKGGQDKLNLLDAQRDADVIGAFKPKDYDEEALKREDERRAKEQKQREIDQRKRDETLAKQSEALSKLRYANEASFQQVHSVGELKTGTDNPYTKVLADQITLSQRMAQQWDFLGKGADSYRAKIEALEKMALDRQLLKLEYATYTQASGLRNQAQSESDQRNGPGLSRADTDYLNVQDAIVNKAIEIPKLWAKAAEILGVHVNPLQQLVGRITALQVASGFGAKFQEDLGLTNINSGISAATGPLSGPTRNDLYGPKSSYPGGPPVYFGPSTVGPQFGVPGGLQKTAQGFNTGAKTSTMILADGSTVTMQLDSGRQDDYAKYFATQAEIAKLSPQAKGQLQEKYADAAISILDEFTPAQIRQAGLQNVYAGAINAKAAGLDQRIQDAQAKAQYGALQDDRLNSELRADESFRNSHPGQDAGKLSDELLISRTNNVNPKDLTYTQFKDRSDALRREAERAENERAEAKAAVDQGLAYQKEMQDDIAKIREAIISGDISMMVQVQNSTQADIDTKALQNANPDKNPKSASATRSGELPTPGRDSTQRYKGFVN